MVLKWSTSPDPVHPSGQDWGCDSMAFRSIRKMCHDIPYYGYDICMSRHLEPLSRKKFTMGDLKSYDILHNCCNNICLLKNPLAQHCFNLQSHLFVAA